MMIDDHNRYEHWRDMWLSGGKTQAFSLIGFHGMFQALVLCAITPVRSATPALQPATTPADVSVSVPMINAAAHCTRRVLSANASALKVQEVV